MVDVELGIKGLVAAVLPPLITIYFSLFKRLFKHPKHVAKFPLYLLFMGLAIAVLYLIDFLDRHPSFYGLPLGVVILSTVLSELIFARRYISFGSSLTCSFGIVTGVLIYFLLFGFVIH